MSQDFVLFKEHDRLGHIILNRPAALNALSFEMIEALQAKVAQWFRDSSINAIVVQSGDKKAFCAGGDVRAICLDYQDGGDQYVRYFETEYALDYLFYAPSKPVIALVDGLTMGGGLGLVNGMPFRVVTERARLSMPETRIGFFPDVGATHFLSRLPGYIGLFLGVTGAEIGADDALFCGLADWMIPSDRLEDIPNGLKTLTWSDEPFADVERFLGKIANRNVPPHAPLALRKEAIDTHFSKKTIAEIRDSLAGEARPDLVKWAQTCLDRLRDNSPLSMAVTQALWWRGRSLGLKRCFDLEYHLALQWFAKGEILEGVRAHLIDKDRAPGWNPARLEGVDPGRVTSFFDGFEKFPLED